MTKHLEISKIGQFASELLAETETAFVYGSSSHGLYLRLLSGWMLFLSYEETPGPLTLNYVGDPVALRNIEIGSTLKCRQSILEFSEPGISISAVRAKVWAPPPPPGKFLSRDHRSRYLDNIYELIGNAAPASPIVELLSYLLDRNLEPGPNAPQYLTILRSLQLACETEEERLVAQSLSAFLGLGKGLTPSGDDFVIGFLLGINRWAYLLPCKLDIKQLNSRIIEQARSQTTTISLNLIECASAGHADERLILALDGIFSGNIEPGVCVNLLAGWGNTSGFDSLTGMALFSLAFLD